MEENINKYLDITLTILAWVIRSYFIVAVVLLIKDFNDNPELYAVVNERPPPSTDTFTYEADAYKYESSTVAECKPLVSLYDFYNKWLKPFLWLVIIHSILSLALKFDIFRKLEDEKD